MDALDAFSGGYSKMISNKAVKNKIPLSGTFELLPYCNMRCKMCYIVHEKSKRTDRMVKNVEFWDNLLDQAIGQGMLYCLITGGEPFIYPGIRELLERINRKPIHLAINTNGTLLDEETVEWLSKIHPGRINISLYGGSNETYERLCGNPRGFDQVTKAFRLLNEYEIPYRVHTTLTPDNYGDYDKIEAVCNHYHVPLKMVYYMFPPYRKDQGMITNSGRFDPQQAAEAAIRVLKSKYKNQRELRMLLEANCASMEKPELFSLYGKRQIVCRGGIASFWVDWRGQASGCGVHNVEKIDLTKESFEEAWRQVVASTEKTRISEKCAFCRYRCICPVCAAAAFCETGTVEGAPKYLCEFSGIYAEMLKEELEKLKIEDV